MKSFAPERLQAALSYWKDTCWFMESIFRVATPGHKLPVLSTQIPPQLFYWRNFEDVVFDNEKLSLDRDQWGTSEAVGGQSAEFQAMYKFPFEFFEWSRKSRRVFHIPVGLWNTLIQATYPAMRWEDVLLPFDSFLITLDGSLLSGADEYGDFLYDTILVTRTAAGISLRLLGAPSPSRERLYLTEKVKHQFDVFLRRGNDLKTVQFLDKKADEWSDMFSFPPAEEPFVIFPQGTPLRSRLMLEANDLLKSLTPEDQKRFAPDTYWGDVLLPAYSDAAKIVVGWCLYLRTLPSTQITWHSKKRKKQKRGRRGVTGIITQPEHICTVLGEARLDPAYYGSSEPPKQGSGFFKRPHWRRSHFARPRGSPLTASKNVKREAMLVRRDLVPLFGIIGGTHTEVISD